MLQVPRREMAPRTKACGPRAGPSSHSSATASPLLAQTWPRGSELLMVVMSRKTAWVQTQFRHFRHHLSQWRKSASVSLGCLFLVHGQYPSLFLSSRAVRGDMLTCSFCFAKAASSFPVMLQCFWTSELKQILWSLLSLKG